MAASIVRLMNEMLRPAAPRQMSFAAGPNGATHTRTGLRTHIFSPKLYAKTV